MTARHYGQGNIGLEMLHSRIYLGRRLGQDDGLEEFDTAHPDAYWAGFEQLANASLDIDHGLPDGRAVLGVVGTVGEKGKRGKICEPAIGYEATETMSLQPLWLCLCPW